MRGYIPIAGIMAIVAIGVGIVRSDPSPAADLHPLHLADSRRAFVGGPKAPDGTMIQCNLPNQLHLRNKGGSDGAGLCVFTSLNHSAYFHNIRVLQDFRDYMTKFPGGGYPAKVTAYINRMCKERHEPVPEYIQVTSCDLDVLKLACRTTRMPGVTYSFSPTGRYGGGRIAHMVSLVSAGAGAESGKGPDGKGWWVILDNNFPGENALEWMGETEFRRTYCAGGQGWCVVFLSPPPPPTPRN